MNMSVPAQHAPLHVAFGVDRGYVPAMGVTLISLVSNNPQMDFVFHVIASLQPDDLEILKRLEKQLRTIIRVHEPDPRCFSRISDKKAPSYAAYYRLFLPELLQDEAEHVLYLDADILCLRALPPLPALEAAIAGVVLDTDQAGRNAALWRESSVPYFNSGVMYINLKRWQEHAITQKVIDLLAANPAFRFPDQDALNLVLEGQLVWLDSGWNRIWETVQPGDTADIVFLHYAGDKPWHAWRSAYLDPPFAKFLHQSPWHPRRLLTPTTRKAKGQYARYLLKKGRWAKACFWYLQFLCARRKSG